MGFIHQWCKSLVALLTSLGLRYGAGQSLLLLQHPMSLQLQPAEMLESTGRQFLHVPCFLGPVRHITGGSHRQQYGLKKHVLC